MSVRPGTRTDFLVIAPPVCAPSEPPSGAFLLAGALRARGFDAVLLDLSLEFYMGVFEREGAGQISRALELLRGGRGPFTPQNHRTACGFLHGSLVEESRRTGWRTTLMDLEPPPGNHSPSRILAICEEGSAPFKDLYDRVLDPALDELKPREVLVSVSYLSQLAGAIDAVRHIAGRGIATTAGGSLLNSLRETGEGSGTLGRALGRIEYGDGGTLAGIDPGETMLKRLRWPLTAGRTDYISPRPVVPFAISTGCFWNRCLFCPDRTQPFRKVGPDALVSLLEDAPREIVSAGPMVHLLDSALAPKLLDEALPSLRRSGAAFYGFARPSRDILEGDLLERAAESGCAMLQFGVESADSKLLESFHKGIDPDTAAEVVGRTAGLGIRTYCYFLFGLPGEDHASRMKTADFIESNAADIDYANISVFNLPVNCELAERAGEFGIRPGHSLRGDERIRLYLPFTTYGESPRHEVRRFLSEAKAAGPGLRSILTRTPRWFRAAHLAMLKIDGRKDVLH